MIKQKIVRVEEVAETLQSSHITKKDIISISHFSRVEYTAFGDREPKPYCLIVYYESKTLQEG